MMPLPAFAAPSRARMTRPLLFLLLAAVAVPAVHAQGAGAFSRMGMGARSLSVGGQVADVTGQASAFQNPALAPFQPGQGVELTSGLLSFGRQWEAVQVGAPLRPRSGVVAGVIHGGVSDIDGRDPDGQPTGTLSTDEYAFFAAFGARLTQRVSGGLGLRIYRNALLEGSQPPTALGVSLGLVRRVSDRLSVGLVVDDLFARYEWNLATVGGGSTTDYFPTRITAGTAYSLGVTAEGRPRGVVSADVEWTVQKAESVQPGGVLVVGGTTAPRDTTLDFSLASVQGRLGGEVWLADAFALRAGVDRLDPGELGASRPSVGFALRRRFDELDLRVDYAAVLEPYAVGVMHMATVRLGL